MMDKPRKKKEVRWVQITVNGLPKLILSKPTVENKENYNVLPHNYGYSFQSTKPTPFFQTEVRGLTRNEICFTSKELEKQRKAKGKEVVDLTKKVNKPITKEKTIEFLKLMKHNEYCVVEQLKKTLTRILFLSLILSSEPYEKAP